MEESKNKVLVYGIGGLVIGVLLTIIIARATSNNADSAVMRMMGYQKPIAVMQNQNSPKPGPNDHMHSAMEGMMMGLDNLKGTQFDQAFIDQMIIHHEGAIEMAEAALENAERQEIKDLAKAIIEAQTKEIEQMKTWRTDWYR